MTYYCADCNYCLRGLPDDRPCPECGGSSRRAVARDSRRIIRLIVVGSLAAIAWGVGATWCMFKAADALFSAPAVTGVTTYQLSGPKSGRYESIAIQSRATRETKSVLLPEAITGSYELTITRSAAPDGTRSTATHKGLDAPTLDAAIVMLTNGSPTNDPDLRREAMVVVQTIRHGLVPPFLASSPPDDPPISESDPPITVIDARTAFSFSKGYVLMSAPTRPVPLIAKVAGLLILLAGWTLIGVFLHRALRRAGFGTPSET
ncbi:MAG: hypothetical protein AMXMBFR47_33230 [Planctomycetota bacterium]